MNRKIHWAFALLVAGSVHLACGPIPAQKPPSPPRPIAFHACVAGASISIDGAGLPLPLSGVTDADGNLGAPFTAIPAVVGAFNFHLRADGYQPYDEVVTLPAGGHDYFLGGCQADVDVSGAIRLSALVSTHVDPSGIPLEQLAAIRGAMWPSASACPGGLILPFGPRPGQPDNIIATDFFANYSADEQLAIVGCLRALGYTHVVMGPIVDSDGYHGQYAPHDWHWEDAAHLDGDNWNKFLDVAQFFWDHGLAPVVFLHPDGWSFEQTRDTLMPLLQLPRAQQLIRIVVPAGWEPAGYDWSSCTWAAFEQWGRQTLPNALVLLHTASKPDGSPYDGPVGTDSRCDDNGHPNGEGWARVAPFIHGWLIQSGPFRTDPDHAGNAREWSAMFAADGDGATFHSIAWHFKYGIEGWPTSSAWGAGRPPLLYAAEQTAYSGYWQNMPEAQRVLWGDLAVRAGSGGYLDGGTVPVPVRR